MSAAIEAPPELARQLRALQHAIATNPGQTRELDDGVRALLRSDARRPLHLWLYREAYAARLVAALRDNFGTLPLALGDEAFDALAWAYIEAHPSDQPSIRWFGRSLPDFMDRQPQWAGHPALGDLARMEWALRDAFDAADADALTVETLGAVPPEEWPGLSFVAVPSLRLLSLSWHVEPLWRALQPADPQHLPDLPPPTAGAHTLLVWRRGTQTQWRSLDPLEARLLEAVCAGQPMAAWSECAAADVGAEAAAGMVAGLLRQWLDEQLFCRVSALTPTQG